MKQLFTYTLIFISTLLLFNCKKYPEGGYHFNFLKNLEGQWNLKLYEVNGIDSTYLTQGSNSITNYTRSFAEFAIAHSGKRADIRLKNHYHGYTVTFNNKKRDMLGVHDDGDRSNFDSIGCLIPNSQQCQRNIFIPNNNQSFTWKIEKLTKSELILSSSQNNSYKIKLSK